MLELTLDQRRRLEQGRAVEVIDPETGRPYVVLSRDLYGNIRGLADHADAPSRDELRRLLARSAISWPRLLRPDARMSRRPLALGLYDPSAR